MSQTPSPTWQDGVRKALQYHYGHRSSDSETKTPGQHVADDAVYDMLETALDNATQSTAQGRAKYNRAQQLWDSENMENLANQINQNVEDTDQPENPMDRKMNDFGLMEMEDQFTAERVNNARGEILTRRVEGLIRPQTTMLNNCFTTVQADPEEAFGQITEMVDIVESFTGFGYHEIDEDRGEIPGVSPSFTQHTERTNTRSAMYGAKVEYENFFKRATKKMSTAEIFALLTLGWSRASASKKEKDASDFVWRSLDPEVLFDNDADANASVFGQMSGMSRNGHYNGTLDVDYDIPRIMDYMRFQMGLDTSSLAMILPRNAWSLLNFRKGYRRFVGRDGEPLYESPQYQEEPAAALNEGGDRYGIRGQSAGFDSPAKAREYFQQTREAKSATLAGQSPAGPNPFLPNDMPNLLSEFMLPNSAMGPMKVILTKYEEAQNRYYAKGHPLREDPATGEPRPIMSTDMMFFDLSKPLYHVETLPPTSWIATNDEYRRSTVTMVEGYGMSGSKRGEQAAVINGAIIDDNYTHEIRQLAHEIQNPSEQPLAGNNSAGLTQE